MDTKVELKVLKCVKAIPSCRDLRVGDHLFKVAHDIRPGGYEYVTCRRISDGAMISFRISHLEDCFEVCTEEVDLLERFYGHV